MCNKPKENRKRKDFYFLDYMVLNKLLWYGDVTLGTTPNSYSSLLTIYGNFENSFELPCNCKTLIV